MAPIRYSLHYEDYSEHLMSRFGKLLQMQSLVDMTLMCSSHTLRVHKAVLAASSAYFQEVLQKQTGEPLIILKMRFSVLKSLVEFMYCGKTQCLEENLDELVSAAHFLKIKGLSKVTKEGLGIANQTELPVFTPPVVINRPPQSLIDLHSQDTSDPKNIQSQIAPATSSSQPIEGVVGRTNKDMVVRIPFDIESRDAALSAADFPDAPRALKPRRGRPAAAARRGWEGAGALGRAAERALLRREHDSRKAIHQLKNLQSRHMQDYMDRVTLSQAVNSICGPESSTSNYMNMDSDLMYMDQAVSSNVLDPTVSYSNDAMGTETITSSFANPMSTGSANEAPSSDISNAMSQYVNALKNAGLPTDLPILFESGDGSYINVNEQVLLDMVQSSEIQYEVIEQPNIIEKVTDPSEIKSIDDLSKSIERGEMLMGSKSYSNNYDKDSTQFGNHDDGINSLNSILPDNLESFADQQNYVVLDSRLQENNSSIEVNNDFSCIDGDMQFFTKSMSDDVKKYYEDQHMSDARVIEQLCPTSSTLDTNFSMSLLDTKISHLGENIGQQFNSLNHEDLRRNDDCYDFELQLPQASEFKEDALDCLMATPKHNNDDDRSTFDCNQLDKSVQDTAEIIEDLMNLEKNMNMSRNKIISDSTEDRTPSVTEHQDGALNQSFENLLNEDKDGGPGKEMVEDLTTMTTSNLPWDNIDLTCKTGDKTNEDDLVNDNQEDGSLESQIPANIIDLTNPTSKAADWDMLIENKENDQCSKNRRAMESNMDDDIPFAVGLLPLKQVQPTNDASLLKRKIDDDLLNVDAKCLRRKVKYKKSV